MVTARKIAALVFKDLRHVWPNLLVVLPLMFLFATNDLEPLTRHKTVFVATIWQLLFLATPLAIWSLVAVTIQSEPLIGDRQYWLTRPFTWHHLAASKLIVIAICINVPLFLFQAIALSSYGISPLEYLPALLWRQVFFSTFVLFPGAAMAAVTRQQGQFALLMLLAVSPFAGLAWINWNDAAISEARWMQATAFSAVTLAGSLAILLLQYARRRLALSRILLAGTVLLSFGCLFVPWETIFRPSSTGPGIRVSLGPTLHRSAYQASLPAYRNVAIELPLVAEGVPPGAELSLDQYRLSIENPEMPDFHPVIDFVRLHGWDGRQGFLAVVVSPAEFQRLRAHAVTVKGWIAVTLLSRAEILDTAPDTLRIPGFGVCTRSRGTCLSPSPHAALSFIRTSSEYRPDQYGRIVPLVDAAAPFPASPWLYPLETYHYEPTVGALLVERPTARFRLDLDFRNVDLNGLARPY